MKKNETSNKPSEFEKKWQWRFKQYANLRDDDAGIAGWSETGLITRFNYFSRLWTCRCAGSIWLDAGCGAGTYSRHLQGEGCAVIGLDYSLGAVLKARERSPERLNWIVGNAKMLPINSRMLDGAICFGVTQALSESEILIQELIRVVKPGGQVWIDALNGRCIPSMLKNLYRRVQSKPAHLRYESPRNMRRIFIQQGMTDVKLYWVPVLPHRLSAYAILLENSLTRWLFKKAPFLGSLFSHSILVTGVKGLEHPG